MELSKNTLRGGLVIDSEKWMFWKRKKVRSIVVCSLDAAAEMDGPGGGGQREREAGLPWKSHQ